MLNIPVSTIGLIILLLKAFLKKRHSAENSFLRNSKTNKKHQSASNGNSNDLRAVETLVTNITISNELHRNSLKPYALWKTPLLERKAIKDR